ncbi:putative lipid II flippase FtsW [Nocardioides sp. CFH 31398]|uniref:putative lipid II flippase FtsW n=1 Tax=Nocardioides sp. CFH 31398 TaxID=2919579 RepID=UPI001F06C1A3|nr:putative lipid II flippase FtsW [Nocardioides sp. CFH 31398]MCH1868278.1 putative lipid II flippase FtsW [Nocardioides sp. CFH 31398]
MTTLDPGPTTTTGSTTGARPDAGGTAAPAGPGLRARLAAPVHAWRALRTSLDRPLATYYLLLGAAGLLLTIGLLMVLSASSVYSYNVHDRDSYAVVTRQLLWVAIGLPCAYVASRLPLRAIRWLAWPALGVAVVLLALTATPLGTSVNGNTNWLALGPLRVQPSEIAKLAIVLWAAHVYALKERRLGELSHVLVPVAPVLLAVTGLVVWQRDLGTALVLAAILLGMLWVVGAPLRLFAIAFAAVASVALWLASTSSERRERLLNFTDPFSDYHDAGWQPAHGLYALSSGGVFGQGIGASQQKWGYLPEAHTDYIFAVLGEELGLVGTLLVLVLFATIAYAAVRIAAASTEPFVRYACFGIVVWLLGQSLINLGMVLALLPVIGIPLPLVSYGGSALLPSLVALGLLIGFARRQPEAARALAERRRG